MKNTPESKYEEVTKEVVLEQTPDRDFALWNGPRKVVSWGPRHEHFNFDVARPAPGEATHFWSVFLHGKENAAELIADLDKEAAAVTLARWLVTSWIFSEYLGEGQTADLDPFPFRDAIEDSRHLAKRMDEVLREFWQGKLEAKRKADKAADDALPF